MKKILTVILCVVSFNVFAAPYSEHGIGNGYEFENICAHGNYANSGLNTAVCMTSVTASVQTSAMLIQLIFKGNVGTCYGKALNKLSYLQVILLTERYFLNHPEELNAPLTPIMIGVLTEEYPVSKVCKKEFSKSSNIHSPRGKKA